MLCSFERQRLLLLGVVLLVVAPAPLRASHAGDAAAMIAEQRRPDSEPNSSRKPKRTTVPLVLTIADGLPPRSAESNGDGGSLRDPARQAVQAGLGWTNTPDRENDEAYGVPHIDALAGREDWAAATFEPQDAGDGLCGAASFKLRSARLRSLPPTGPPRG